MVLIAKLVTGLSPPNFSRHLQDVEASNVSENLAFQATRPGFDACLMGSHATRLGSTLNNLQPKAPQEAGGGMKQGLKYARGLGFGV